MINAKQILIFLFLSILTTLNAQNDTLLIQRNWLAFDDFALIDFQENGIGIIEYAYCTYCKGNYDSIKWELKENLLILNQDTLEVTKIDRMEVELKNKMDAILHFKALKRKEKKSKIKKENVQNFLMNQAVMIKYTDEEGKKARPIQFKSKGQMWIESSKFRGQWALKSFYNRLFLIYINRFSTNRNFPLVKINSFKKGKLVGHTIPQIEGGGAAMIEISK